MTEDVMTTLSAKELRGIFKDERREEYCAIYRRVLKENPEMKPAEVIAKEKRVSVRLVYAVLSGKR
jgi:hypothetical protein